MPIAPCSRIALHVEYDYEQVHRHILIVQRITGRPLQDVVMMALTGLALRPWWTWN